MICKLSSSFVEFLQTRPLFHHHSGVSYSLFYIDKNFALLFNRSNQSIERKEVRIEYGSNPMILINGISDGCYTDEFTDPLGELEEL